MKVEPTKAVQDAAKTLIAGKPCTVLFPVPGGAQPAPQAELVEPHIADVPEASLNVEGENPDRPMQTD